MSVKSLVHVDPGMHRHYQKEYSCNFRNTWSAALSAAESCSHTCLTLMYVNDLAAQSHRVNMKIQVLIHLGLRRQAF